MNCNNCPYRNPVTCCHNVLRLGSPVLAWLLAFLIKARAAVLITNRDEPATPHDYHPAIPDLLKGYWNVRYEPPFAGLYGSLIYWNQRGEAIC